MSVPALTRTLDLIEAFSQMRRPMTVSALAKLLDVPTSSCHGIVKTLEDRGYLIDLKHQGGYYFTKRFKMHVDRIASYDPLPEWLRPAMAELRDSVQETVLLAKLAGPRAVYLEVLESAQSVRYIAQVGDTRPLHASAAGKALLGAMTPQQRHSTIQNLDLARHNIHTLGTPEELESNLEAGISQGWFMTRGEYLTDVAAVAVSLKVDGELYAMVVAGPATRMETQLGLIVGQLRGLKEQTAQQTG